MNASCLLLIAVLASGATDGAVDSTMPNAELDSKGRPALKAVGGFTALSVPDAEATAHWYEDKLGLKVALRPPASPGFRVIVMEARGWTLELLQRSDARRLSDVAPQIGSRDQIHGVFKSGVFVANFDKTLALLEARGVPIAFGPFPARDGQNANVIIRDLDGNLIQFIEAREHK